jgi:FkbM family methyltransferase
MTPYADQPLDRIRRKARRELGNLRHALRHLPRRAMSGLAKLDRRLTHSTDSGLSVDDTVRLLYGPEATHQLRARVRGLVERQPVHDLHGLRHVLSSLDRQVAPSPVQVRFGPEDVVTLDVSGFRMVLDKEDPYVSQTLREARIYEPHLTRVIERYCKPGMTFVDAGAQIGYYTLLASRLVGPSGCVVAVEPNSENCRLILLSTAASQVTNVQLLPVALDQSRGWSYFSTHTGPNGGLIPGATSDLAQGRGVVVPTFPLDDLLQGPIHFIKMDLEGAEGRAVSGAKRLIEEFRPVVTTELSFEMLSRVSGTTPEKYLGWFQERGYRVSVINRKSGELEDVDDLQGFVAKWGRWLRIEDLLLLPREQC